MPSPFDQGYPMNKSGRPVTSRCDINSYSPNDTDSPYGYPQHMMHLHHHSNSNSNSSAHNIDDDTTSQHQHPNISIDSSNLWFNRHSNKTHKKNMVSIGTTTTNNKMPALPNNSYTNSSASASAATSLMSNGDDHAATGYGGNITYDAIMRQPSTENNLMLETPKSEHADIDDIPDNTLSLRLQSPSVSFKRSRFEKQSRSTSYFERAKTNLFINSISDFIANMTRNIAISKMSDHEDADEPEPELDEKQSDNDDRDIDRCRQRRISSDDMHERRSLYIRTNRDQGVRNYASEDQYDYYVHQQSGMVPPNNNSMTQKTPHSKVVKLSNGQYHKFVYDQDDIAQEVI